MDGLVRYISINNSQILDASLLLMNGKSTRGTERVTSVDYVKKS